MNALPWLNKLIKASIGIATAGVLLQTCVYVGNYNLF